MLYQFLSDTEPDFKELNEEQQSKIVQRLSNPETFQTFYENDPSWKALDEQQRQGVLTRLLPQKGEAGRINPDGSPVRPSWGEVISTAPQTAIQGLKKGGAGIAQAVGGSFLDDIPEDISEQPVPERFFDRNKYYRQQHYKKIGEALESFGKKHTLAATEKIQELTPEQMSTAQQYFTDLSVGLGEMIPSLGVGAANPVAGMTTFMAQAYGNRYSDLRNEGFSHEEASNSALRQAGIEGVTEVIPFGQTLKIFFKGGGKGAVSRGMQAFARVAVPDAAGEYLAELGNVLEDEYTRNPDMTPEDAIRIASDPETQKQALYSASIGGGMGMVMGGGAQIGNKMLRRNEHQTLLNNNKPDVAQSEEAKASTETMQETPAPVSSIEAAIGRKETTEQFVSENEADFQSVLAWVRDPDGVEPPTQQALLRHSARVRAVLEQEATEEAAESPLPPEGTVNDSLTVQKPNAVTEPISAPVANEQQVTPPQAYLPPEGNPERLLSLVSNIDEPVQAQPELTTESWNDYYKQFGEDANDYEWEAIADYFLNPEANSIQPPREAVERHIDKIYELEDSLTSADKEMIRELASARKQEPVQPDLSIAESVSRYTNEVADITRDTTPNYISQRQKIADIYKQKMGKALSPKQSLINADKLINAMNTGEHDGWLNPDKKYSRAVFEELTGVKLPNTIEETNRAVAEYVASRNNDIPLFKRSERGGLSNFVKASLSDSNNKQVKTIIQKRGEFDTKRLEKDTGFDASGYERVIDNYAVKHIFKNHSDEKSEAARGNIAITEADFDLIPDIVANYDTVQAEKTATGRDAFKYSKRYNGTTYYVEEIRTGKGELATTTLYKTKTKKAAEGGERIPDASTVQPHTSETLPPSADKKTTHVASDKNIVPERENVKKGEPEYKRADDKPLKETSDGGRVKHETGQITPDTRRLEKALERDYRRTLQGRGVQGVSTGESGKDIPAGWIRTHEVSDPLLSRLGRAYGKRVILISNSRPDIVRFEGVTLPSIPDAIFINADASRPHLAIFGHELNHHLKKDLPEVYESLKAELFSMLSPAAIKQYQDKLKDFPEGMDIDLVTDELIGDLVGDSFMKPSFWKTLSERMPEVFRDIAESVIKFFNSALKRMKIRKDLGSTEYFKDMEKAKAAVEKAYTEYAAIMQFENPKPDMYVVHNLTAGKLIHADKIGGLAVPSLAVARTSTGGFESFGEISLIADKDMIDPKKNKAAKTFDADIYSPRYPKDGDTALLENIDHVVRMMNLKPLRGGEGGYYGAGSVRSGVAREFQSIQEIKDSRNKIISKQEFEGVANRAEDDLIRIALQLMPYYKNNPDAVSYIENFGESVREYALEGKKVIERDFSNLPDEQLKQIDGFLNRLAKVPTEYFESKVQRAVGIGEFKYALVPEGTSDKVTKILEKHRLEVVPYKKGERAAVVDKLDDVLFKRIIEDKPLFKRTPEEQLSEFEEVEKRFKAAQGLSSVGFVARTKELLTQIKNSATRHFKYLDPKADAEVMNMLRVHEAVPERAKMKAVNILTEIAGDMNKADAELFSRHLILEDIVYDIDRGLFADGKLPFGYETVSQVRADLQGIKKKVAGNERVKAALGRRKSAVSQMRQILVDEGLLPESVLENDTYYRHQVLEYMNLRDEQYTGTSSGDLRTKTKGFQKARTGSDMDYNTNYFEAEFEWIAQGLAQIETKRILKRLQEKTDISASLRKEAARLSKEKGEKVDWETLIPEGYKKWQPEKGNHFYPVLTVKEKQLEELIAGVLPAEDLSIVQKFAMGLKKEEWVIPERLADTLDNFRDFKDESPLAKISASTMSKWKQLILLSPPRWIKYNLNNMTGDLDVVLAYDPKILRYGWQAMQELADYAKHGKVTPSIQKAIEQDVIGSGISVNEIPDITKSGFLRRFAGRERNAIMKAVDLYWDKAKGWSSGRENWMRYAAFLHFQKEIQNNPGKKIYGVSKKHEIDQIKNPTERAAKLARELLGDYGNLSDSGNWIRRHIVPFWSWMEINLPRYVRLIQNVREEGRSGVKAGLAKTAGSTLKLGVKMSILYGAITLWNSMFFDDEDEELRKSGNRQLHLILGRREDGSIISLRVQGALSDALGWFGLEDAVSDIADLKSGKVSLKDKAVEAVDAPIQKLFGASLPFQKMAYELISGFSYYPDFRNPRPITDNMEHVARLFALNVVYNHLAGKPTRGGAQDLFSLVGYTTDPEQSYYYLARNMAAEYLEKEGKGRNIPAYTDDMKLTATLKKALKYNDKEAIQKYLAEYIDRQGSVGKARLKLQGSIERMSPLGLIPKKDRHAFMATLNKEEREVIEKAEEWHRQFLAESKKIDWAGAMKKSEKYNK